ncbi:Fic family protein [Streptacidiphilus fuscans]|uniref:Fic family protein n=1 Tax=Streptacidiphilus fuscans TaxID=2789292 RepID=A0A931FGH5_9ACTN|nr:Fic family protein [Streptacidiphilus fuscans]MBF9072633.1 Fic family protein [Streptacidiphilus fuscans]
MLYATPNLHDADQAVLAEIGEMRDRLRLHLRTPRRWEGQLRRNLTARAIAGSNTIEGYAASVSDVEDIMVGEAPIEANDTVAAEIEGYRQAMTYIQRLAEAGDDFSYSKGLLNSLHFMMQGHHLLKRPGWWRSGPVYVTSAEDPTIAAYTAPDPEQVPALTGELVEWLNEGDLDAPGLVRASMAHLNLVAIHPWSDGNGRMSRALHTLVLAREGIMAPEFSSIEEWLGRARNTYRYYDVLAEVGGPVWTPDRDTLPWVRFCLRAHHQQAQTVERQVHTTREVWTGLEQALEQRDWPDRMIYALYPAAMSNRIRRATYQADAELSEQQAQRDIRELVRAGWLTAKGEAQGRYYVAGPDLPEEITHGVREPKPLRDPYA